VRILEVGMQHCRGNTRLMHARAMLLLFLDERDAARRELHHMLQVRHARMPSRDG